MPRSGCARRCRNSFAELSRPVALSDRPARDLSHIRPLRNEYLSHGKEPTSEELSAATGLAPAQIESLLATERMPRGIEDRLSAEDQSGPTIGETIADPVAEQAHEKVLDELEIHEVLDLTNELEARERTVIRSHYGLGQKPRTLSEIGTGHGLTAKRARQIEAAALTKLREHWPNPRPSVAPRLEVHQPAAYTLA